MLETIHHHSIQLDGKRCASSFCDVRILQSLNTRKNAHTSTLCVDASFTQKENEDKLQWMKAELAIHQK